MRFLPITIFLVSFLTLSLPTPAFARTTPADIVNEQVSNYEAKLATYSPANQQKIKAITEAVAQANADACAVLGAVMERQGAVLDEYFARKNFKETESIKDARYWLTFAHEAIDYQKQRVYLPTLTGEANIQRDSRVMINSFQSQLNYAVSTAVKSKTRIQTTVSGKGSQVLVDPIKAASESGGD